MREVVTSEREQIERCESWIFRVSKYTDSELPLQFDLEALEAPATPLERRSGILFMGCMRAIVSLAETCLEQAASVSGFNVRMRRHMAPCRKPQIESNLLLAYNVRLDQRLRMWVGYN